MAKEKLSPAETAELLNELQERFENNMSRHKGMKWSDVAAKIGSDPDTLWSLSEMERTGGEPDVVVLGKKADDIVFVDYSAEPPNGHRSTSFDPAGNES